MARQTTSLPLALPPRPPGTPAARWLYESLRARILAGEIRPGARLPATRDLAAQHALSRGTIVAAFDQLRAEGYVEGAVGSGTYVSAVLPDELLTVGRTARPRATPQRPPRRHLSALALRTREFPGLETGPTRAFRTNRPALELFPTTLWAQVAARRLRRATASVLAGSPPMGYAPLRRAVADYLGASRGVKCEPGQVAIVSGVQEALDLVARLFVDPGDVVCVEDPGYPGASLAFGAAGAKIVPVAVDEEGMRVPGARARAARLAYVTPAHQFPLGVSMSLGRRLALIEWARATGALLFEDDYDAEYRYSGRPLPALQGLDKHGVVLFAGSFSKVLHPSLRVGYVVVPPDLVDHVAAAISLSTRHAPTLGQAVLCDFITEGHFARHLRRTREVYAERLGVLLDGARTHWGGLLEIAGVEAGLQTAAWLRDGVRAEAVARAAAAREVEVAPLSRYARTALPRSGLQLGFAAVDAHELRRGIRELAEVLEGHGGR